MEFIPNGRVRYVGKTKPDYLLWTVAVVALMIGILNMVARSVYSERLLKASENALEVACMARPEHPTCVERRKQSTLSKTQ